MSEKAGIKWIASYPRSGNTWVRMFLRAYVSGSCQINRRDRIVNSQFEITEWQSVSAVPLDWLDRSARTDYLRAVLRNTLYRANGVSVMMKTHDQNATCNDCNLIDSRLTTGGVYIVRDPRDVVCSYADYNGLSIDEMIGLMGDKGHTIAKKQFPVMWEFLGSWSDHVKSWASDSGPPVRCVRYEDLQDHTHDAFRTVVESVGLPVDDSRIDTAIDQVQFDRLRQQEDKSGFDESEHKGDRFFRRGVVGGWRDTLTSQQAARIENDHAEVMQQVGYQLEELAR